MELEVICTIGEARSGTTVFYSMLASHPEIHSLGEIFNPDDHAGYFGFLEKELSKDPSLIHPKHNTSLFEKFMDTKAIRYGTRKLHIDVKYDSSHYIYDAWKNNIFVPGAIDYFRVKGYYVINIIRQNYLARLVSNKIAHERNIFHYRVGNKNVNPAIDVKVHIEPSNLINQFHAQERKYNLMRNFYKNYPKYLELNYEDWFDENGWFKQELLSQLAKFLNIGNKLDSKPKFNKIIKQDFSELIANYEEVKKTIENTRFAKFLNV